jgi:hypothetical protein
MAKKRVFLDECCRDDLRACFPQKAHVYTARNLGVSGKEDTSVIDKAITKRCVIVTVNKDFLDYYRDNPSRKGKNGTWFFGLIFLKPSKSLTKVEQLRRALREIIWNDSRDHDDLMFVSALGKTRHQRLCHPECAAAFPAEQAEWG